MPPSEFLWFVPLFGLFWLAIAGGLSLMGGWHELSKRYANRNTVDGQRFFFASGEVTGAFLPTSYGSCLFVTVGPLGIALSILFPFRFLHPPLLIPWSDVERCQQFKRLFARYVVVHIVGANTSVRFYGRPGRAVLESWVDLHRQP